ncbi:MAG: hypothetical protein WA624_17120, partial [Methylocella sp.]
IARVPPYTRRHSSPSKQAAHRLHRVVVMVMVVVVVVVVLLLLHLHLALMGIPMVTRFFGHGFGSRGLLLLSHLHLSHRHRRDSRRHACQRRRVGQARETKGRG